MKTFLIAAITADGFIGKNSAHLADWTCKEDKQFFVKKTKEAGVIIMGRNTYNTIGRPLADRHNIIYSEEDIAGVETTRKAPQELLQDLKSRGYKEVAICGGAQIYTMFMEAKLVDTLSLTVEPILFGSGIKLFNKELDVKLQLKSMEKLNNAAILLEYNVVQ